MSKQSVYLDERGFEPEQYDIVTWPNSQDFMGYTEEEDVHLINDEEGLEIYGGSAYIIPKGLEPFEDLD